MTVTTVKLKIEVRDHLARIATEDYAGASLSDTVARLLAEHEEARLRRELMAAYARLQDDQEQWTAYQAELDEWDGVVADGDPA